MTDVNGSNSSTLPDTDLRADARRNRARVLAAARDVFVELGSDAPLEEVARRASVGIATLYRRFPDRESLMRAVVIDVLGRAGDEALRARAEEPDAFAGLARYMHRALDLRISAVMPALLGQISFEDDEVRAARDAAVEPVLRLVDDAHAEGTLRPDVAFGDIGTLLVRLSRPLPGGFPADVDASLAHRHLELFIEGLRVEASRRPGKPLPGDRLELAALRATAAQRRADHPGGTS